MQSNQDRAQFGQSSSVTIAVTMSFQLRASQHRNKFIAIESIEMLEAAASLQNMKQTIRNLECDDVQRFRAPSVASDPAGSKAFQSGIVYGRFGWRCRPLIHSFPPDSKMTFPRKKERRKKRKEEAKNQLRN